MLQTILRTTAIAAISTVFILVSVWATLKIYGNWSDDWSGYTASLYVSDGVCNIAVVPIIGDIVPYSGAYGEEGPETTPLVEVTLADTLSAIGAAESDPYIKGIFTPINTGGGAPVTSEFIAHALLKTKLPVAALIADVGASGGYLIATAADTIFASALSDVGSIGLTMSYLDETEKNTKEGMKYVTLSSAKYKDSGDPDKTLTAEERRLFERDLQENHKELVRQIAENRKLPVEEVEKMADGSTMTGSSAVEHKLIDGIGDKESVRVWFANKLNLPRDEVVFCQ